MRHSKRSGTLLLVALLIFRAPSHLMADQYHVSGTVANQHVDTTVDSEQAKYYVEHYLAGDRALPRQAGSPDTDLGTIEIAPSDVDGLRRLTQRFSTDLAAIYFVARLYQEGANQRAQEGFHAHFEQLRASGAFPEELSHRKGYLLAFVPGFAYKKDLTTGADFARQRRILSEQGFQTALIETDELGSVEDNAIVISQELTRLARRSDKIILVSASKGGPEVALALSGTLSEETRRHIPAWISVGGLLRGSPYADQALRWPRRWFAELAFVFMGLRSAVIRDLSTEVRRPAFAALRIPPEILTLQYVGVPLSGQVSRSVRGRYEALRPLGPNDGLTLLADELVPGGIVVTDLGLDHYFRDPAIDLKTIALAFVVFDELDRRTGASAYSDSTRDSFRALSARPAPESEAWRARRCIRSLPVTPRKRERATS